MANTNKIKRVTKVTKIVASEELWSAFLVWMKQIGCTSIPEGLRAAMREVSKYSPNTGNCKEKSGVEAA